LATARAPTPSAPRSLPDALPISVGVVSSTTAGPPRPSVETAAALTSTKRPTPASAAARNRAIVGQWLSRSKPASGPQNAMRAARSEEHTSELQSREKLVCRLLLE